MNRYRRKTLRQRLNNALDDLSWWWERNRQGLLGGFALGLLVAVVAAELAWRA